MFPHRWEKHQPDRSLETLGGVCFNCPVPAVPKGAGAGGQGRLPGRVGGGMEGWMDGPCRKERRPAEGRCSVCSGHRMSLECRNTALRGVHPEYFQKRAPRRARSVQSGDFTSIIGVIIHSANFDLLLKALGGKMYHKTWTEAVYFSG